MDLKQLRGTGVPPGGRRPPRRCGPHLLMRLSARSPGDTHFPPTSHSRGGGPGLALSIDCQPSWLPIGGYSVAEVRRHSSWARNFPGRNAPTITGRRARFTPSTPLSRTHGVGRVLMAGRDCGRALGTVAPPESDVAIGLHNRIRCPCTGLTPSGHSQSAVCPSEPELQRPL